MKKILIFIFLFFLLGSGLPPQAQASPEEGKGRRPWVRPAVVLSRGLINLAGLPFEIPRTTVLEAEMHPRLWPVSVLPRTFTNLMIRTTSAANDIALYPWIAPFMSDLAPLTKPMGLSDYPWQID